MPANWKPKTVWTGDNLLVMRGMNSKCVDLIYLGKPIMLLLSEGGTSGFGAEGYVDAHGEV